METNNLVYKDSYEDRKICFLDNSEKRDDSFLAEMRQEIFSNVRGKVVGRPLNHENCLIPDISIIQNIMFFSNSFGVDYDKTISILESYDDDINDIFNKKREAFSLVEWCGIGAMLHFCMPYDYFLINLSFHQFVNTKFKNLIINQIDDINDATIFAYSHPHGIHNMKDFFKEFVIKSDGDLSCIMDFKTSLGILERSTD